MPSRRPHIVALAYVVLSCCCSPSNASFGATKPSRSEVYDGVGYDIFDRQSCHGHKHVTNPRATGVISVHRRKTLEQCALLCNGKPSCEAIYWMSSKCYLQSSTCAKKVSGWWKWWKFLWAEKKPTASPTKAPTAATTLAPTVEGGSVISALPRDYRRVTLDGTDYYPFLFAKTLAHSGEHWMPTVDAVESVIKAVDSTEDREWKRLLKAIRQHPETARTLEGVQSGRGRTGVAAAETATLRAHELPAVDSIEHLCQQIEIYWQSLLRDVPFSEYPTSPQVKAAVSEINKCVAKGVWRGPIAAGFGKKPKVSPGTLFRGIGSGELEGPYVSQFLLNDFTYGGLLVEQKYLVEADVPPSVTAKGWLDMQHGISNAGNLKPSTERKRTVNGRVIGSEVHMDAVFQFYYNAAMQIVQFPELELEDGWGKDVMRAGVKSSAWSDGGVPDLFVSIAEVSIGALRHAWWNKWQGTMQIRPEVYAARLDQMKHPGSAAGRELRKISDDAFLQALDGAFGPTFEAIAEANKVLAGSEQGPVLQSSEQGDFRPYFLAMLYGEGSPTHPSYPAGHAVVAGACITVLKAFSRTHNFKNGQYRRVKWEREAVEAASSHELTPLGTVRGMTVIGELNKLGSNVALARDFAGVHYRSDSDFGIELGEAYALEFLRSQLLEYASPHMDDRRFLIELYNGTLVEISRQGVEQKKAPVV